MSILGLVCSVCVCVCVCVRVRKVVFCAGKHYYALDSYRKEKGFTDTAIVRVEVCNDPVMCTVRECRSAYHFFLLLDIYALSP